MTLPCTGPLTITAIRAELGNPNIYDLKGLCDYAGLGAPYEMGRFHCYTYTVVTKPTATPGSLSCVDKNDCANPYAAKATWVNTDTTNKIHIQWYLNGSLATEVTLNAGTTTTWFGGPDAGVVCGDDIYCKAWYTNSAGNGPVATASPVHLNVDPCTGQQSCA